MHVSTPRAALALSLLATLLAVLLAAPSAQAQATIGDCEKIEAADAYNQCLARFGPAQKTQNLAPERPGDVKGSSEEAAAGAGRGVGRVRVGGRAGRRGGYRRAAAGGRKRLVIAVRRRRR